ncbi:MAG: adenosine kinase [Bacteroidales bacterium]|nr:adenosine kinase [Bacteroidales bacterium]
MKRILGMGNALTDVLVQLDNETHLENLGLPKGSMQLVDSNKNAAVQEYIGNMSKQMIAGGSASNTMRGIACLGGYSTFVGMVGNDEVGKVFEQELKDTGVSTNLFFSNTPSGTATAFISPDGERTFATHLGAAIGMTAELLTPELFKGYDIFHIEGYLVQNHDLIRKAVHIAKYEGLKVSLDLASYNVVEENLEFLQTLVRDYVDILFANEEEALAFTGKQPEEALDIISKMVEYAVVKVGKKGSLIKYKGNVVSEGITDNKRVDTTGAGDFYAAGFLYALANGMTVEKAAHYGKVLSGNIIEVVGVKLTAEQWNNIKRML